MSTIKKDLRRLRIAQNYKRSTPRSRAIFRVASEVMRETGVSLLDALSFAEMLTELVTEKSGNWRSVAEPLDYADRCIEESPWDNVEPDEDVLFEARFEREQTLRTFGVN